jgi:hypothetical protein
MQPIWQTGLSDSRERLVEPRRWVTLHAAEHVGPTRRFSSSLQRRQGSLALMIPKLLSFCFAETRPSSGEVMNDGGVLNPAA